MMSIDEKRREKSGPKVAECPIVELEPLEGKIPRYRLVKLENAEGELLDFELHPANLSRIYNCADPSIQRAMEKEGLIDRKQMVKPAPRVAKWPVLKVKPLGGRELIEFEFNPSNMARIFHCSESSIRRALEKDGLL